MGPQGGLCSLTDENARGGYTYGAIKLNSDVTVNVCVGEQDQFYKKSEIKGFPSGGFNGGGNGATGKRNGSCSGGGGGATDIRLSDNITKLIVAGGGGGCVEYGNGKYAGGAGGGLIGGDGKQSNESKGTNIGRGGQQFFTDNAGNYTAGDGTKAESGEFGIGGNGSTISQASAGGGGGGYFGGGGGADIGSGGGGSGFLPSYMIGEVLRGDVEFPSPNGGKEKGHPGNGYAKITKLNADSCKIAQTISIPPIIFILSLIK